MFTVPDNTITANIEMLAACAVLDENSIPVALRSLWEKKPAIFVFLRHFGCPACRLHALDVWENREKYLSKGAAIHFIGNGSPFMMQAFREDNGLEEASFFTDPSLKSFNAAGFRRGFWISPGEFHGRGEFIWKALKYQMEKTNQGNVWQLGGVLVICPGDKIKYQYVSQALGDYPPSADIPNAEQRMASK